MSKAHAIMPDPYDVALEEALHERGLHKATYVAGLEQENLQLRKLLIASKPYLPQYLKTQIAVFIDDVHEKDHKRPPEHGQ